MKKIILLLILFPFSLATYAAKHLQPAITQSIPVSDLQAYHSYPDTVQTIIAKATVLTKKNLTYLFGSENPSHGGMDCSGTIYYLLSTMQNNVPRDSYGLYQWALKKGQFHRVKGHSFHSPEFSKLKPGDLLFWAGTYRVNRNPPVSHVMIYLGENKNHQPLMFGSSNGRTYLNKRMWGVSVFDFKLPSPNSSSRFLGYSCIPNLTCDAKS